MRKRTVVGLLLLFLTLPAAAGAQQKGGIELKTVSEVDVVGKNAQGEREVKRVDAGKISVVPGGVVIFTTTFSNKGSKLAERVAIKNPVPPNMTYVDKSAEGEGTKIEFSIDNGKTYNAPDTLMVTDGQGKTRRALASDYTHIRWIVTKPLAPGGKGSVSFKAKVK
ncbi:MAG: hypothetical protein AABZ15_07025 [Nitrospirota bacterium]